MNKKIYIDKLFPCPPTKKYDNLMIDYETMTYISPPNVSEIITTIIELNIPDDMSNKDITILDGTACVGGDTISFGKTFGTVISTEIDKNRYNMLVNNVKEFNLYNVVPVNCDCTKLFTNINFIDIMYFDPPWGGKSYKYEKNLRLKISNLYVDEIINSVIDGNVKCDVKLIVFKLPKNYDLYDLYTRTKSKTYTIYLYELEKMYIVVYKKN